MKTADEWLTIMGAGPKCDGEPRIAYATKTWVEAIQADARMPKPGVFEGYVDRTSDSQDESSLDIFQSPDIPVLGEHHEEHDLYRGDRPGGLGLLAALNNAKEHRQKLRVTVEVIEG